MPSTYSPSLRIELIGSGEQSGTWGTTTNTNLGTLLEASIAGYVAVSVTSANQAFTALDGAADQARNAVIALTTTTTAAFAVYAPPQEKTYIIYNTTAYAATIYNSTVLGNTTAAGLGVVVPAGRNITVFSDATNFRAVDIANLTGAVTSVGNATSLGSFTSAQLSGALTDETGTGANVFATSPTLVTPLLGTPTSGILTSCTGVNYDGYKNRLINGAMVIDQRNGGASGTAVGYTVDRFAYYGSQASKGTWQQSAGAVTPPSGFINYLGFTSSSAYSVLTADQFYLYQRIEGVNTADLSFGSASAVYVTLSFWVRSSLTGTFGGFLTNSAASRTYPFSYTISVANTWEQKTVSVAGDTTGTWLTTSGTGIGVGFNLGTGATYSATANTWTATSFVSAPTGATSVVGTNGATFYITGVQLEKGATATSFDVRSIGQELGLCQRYYEIDANGNTSLFWSGNITSANAYFLPVKYAVTKRTSATVVLANINNSGFPNTISVGEQSVAGFRVDVTANFTVPGGYFRASWTASAEL